MLDARQLGLKLIANVTYGYTSAHFSGRMPCVEVILYFQITEGFWMTADKSDSINELTDLQMH